MTIVHEPMFVVYGLYDVADGDKRIRYVGLTRHGAQGRLATHFRSANHKKTKNYPVYNWIRKHGKENIRATILEDCRHDEKLLNEREQHWISFYRNLIGVDLLNIRFGGSSSPLAESTKRKMSDSARGRQVSPETRAKMSIAGLAYVAENGPRPVHKWTDEERAAWSIKMTGANNGFYGRAHSAETLAKIAESRPSFKGELNPFYGKTHTPETIVKILAANIGRKDGPETILKKSRATRGESNPATSLSDAEVVAIHDEYCRGKITQKELGMKYGVSQVVVSGIATGRTWKYLGLEPRLHGCGRPKPGREISLIAA